MKAEKITLTWNLFRFFWEWTGFDRLAFLDIFYLGVLTSFILLAWEMLKYLLIIVTVFRFRITTWQTWRTSPRMSWSSSRYTMRWSCCSNTRRRLRWPSTRPRSLRARGGSGSRLRTIPAGTFGRRQAPEAQEACLPTPSWSGTGR